MASNENDLISDQAVEHSTDNMTNKQFIIIPLKDEIICPNYTYSFFVGRKKTIETLQAHNKTFVFLLQKDPQKENPGAKDFHSIGLVGQVVNMINLTQNKYKQEALNITVKGQELVEIKTIEEVTNDKGLTYLVAHTEPFQVANDMLSIKTKQPSTIINDCSKEDIAKINSFKDIFSDYMKRKRQALPEIMKGLDEINDINILICHMLTHAPLSAKNKYQVLSAKTIMERIDKLYNFIAAENAKIMEIEALSQKLRKTIEDSHRKAFLMEQLDLIKKAIAKFDGTSSATDIDQLKEKAAKLKLPEEIAEKLNRELARLDQMHPQTSEYQVLLNWAECMISLPWNTRSDTAWDELIQNNKENTSKLPAAKKRKLSGELLQKAQTDLESTHYGLKDVKERIIEELAILTRVNSASAPILCLVGPPGVGKTSIVKSIAKALNRKMVKIALNGVNDAAEIKGHRSTYVGAQPGRIISALRTIKVKNPLILLDEIGALGADRNNNPAHALLDVLDPDHRAEFADAYLGVPFPLDEVMFIATANNIDHLPAALKDRLEVIDLRGYLKEEKLQMAKKYIINAQQSKLSLNDKDLIITDAALQKIVYEYVSEPGVRKLERKLGTLCRKALTKMTLNNLTKLTIDQADLIDYLGLPLYANKIEREALIGVASGLAWTSVGGKLMPIETALLPNSGEGKLKITGQLGEVMKESVQIAWSIAQIIAASAFKINPEDLHKMSIHVHAPDGSTPKDGPSAGITLVIAMLSSILGRPVSTEFAMTGEINLSQQVTAIGGLREKLLAAIENNVTTVFIPKENEATFNQLKHEEPELPFAKLKVIPVKNLMEAVKHIFGTMDKRACESNDILDAKRQKLHG